MSDPTPEFPATPPGAPFGATPGGHGYDPNQPRVPAGHRDGGQWTRTPGSGGPASARREAIVDRTKQEAWGSYVNTYRPDGTLAEQRVFNRDGSRIVSEFNVPGGPGKWDERHTVVTADGGKVTFQNSGDAQTIYDGDGRLVSATLWTKDGPESLPVGELAFVAPAISAGAGLAARLGPAAARAAIAAGLALFAWLSGRKDRDGTAVFAFKASKYENSEPEGQPELRWVGYVKRDELSGVCKKLGTVQKFTDDAVKKVREDGDYKGPASFGSKVHKVIADKIKEVDDPNFKSEVSAIKSNLEAGEDGERDSIRVGNLDFEPGESVTRGAKYGAKNSVRIDAYENHRENSTVCVYDPKTGRRGLSFPRMAELAEAARSLFHYNPQHIIVIEVRPGQGQP